MTQVRPTVTTVLAGALLWGVLVLPSEFHELGVGSFLRIPLEGLLVVAVLLVLPARAHRVAALLVGLALALVLLLKVLDLGFSAVLDRRFHEIYDWSYLGLGYAVLGDWIGEGPAAVAVVALGLAVLGTVALMGPAVLRVARAARERPRTSARALAAAGVVWGVCAVSGAAVAGTPVASASTARLVAVHASGLHADRQAQEVFARSLVEDPATTPAEEDPLVGLQGKDVLIVTVESYGRVAVTDPTIAPGVTSVLDQGTKDLHDAGFSARSGYLTSPTFGGSSWLAHATLQSGVWTPDQRRYDQLMDTDRLTLTGAFGRAGWRTLFVMPSVGETWPEGRAFYGFDELLAAPDLGYHGPGFGWGTIPDQHTLSTLWRTVLADADRPPVMAEVKLVSSHLPWPPTPPLVDWDTVGDGSVFACMPGCGRDPAEVEGMEHVRERYGEAVEYVLRTVTSFVQTYGDDDLVVVLLGDHQPWSYVSGEDPGHDVPVTVISADPAVLGRVSDWGWTPGLDPGPDAPVWRMDAFRDNFLTAFGPGG